MKMSKITNPVRIAVEAFLDKKGYGTPRRCYIDTYGGKDCREARRRTHAARMNVKFVGIKLVEKDLKKLQKELSKQFENVIVHNPTCTMPAPRYNWAAGLRVAVNRPAK